MKKIKLCVADIVNNEYTNIYDDKIVVNYSENEKKLTFKLKYSVVVEIVIFDKIFVLEAENSQCSIENFDCEFDLEISVHELSDSEYIEYLKIYKNLQEAQIGIDTIDEYNNILYYEDKIKCLESNKHSVPQKWSMVRQICKRIMSYKNKMINVDSVNVNENLIEESSVIFGKEKKLIFVTHDCNYGGAQVLALNMLSVLKNVYKYDILVIARNSGALLDKFERNSSKVLIFRDNERFSDEIKEFGATHAIANTVVTGDVVSYLSNFNIKIVHLVHELDKTIQQHGWINLLENSINSNSKIILPTEYVYKKLRNILNFGDNQVSIKPQGLFNKDLVNLMSFPTIEDTILTEILKSKYNIPKNKKIVLSVGMAEKRKGFDIFTKTSEVMGSNYHFVWVGNADDESRIDARKFEQNNPNLTLINNRKELKGFYKMASLFFLSSREDPFPSVVLEALSYGNPILAFKDCGGFTEIVSDDFGKLVELENYDEIIKAIENLTRYSVMMNTKKNTATFIETEFDFIGYVDYILDKLDLNVSRTISTYDCTGKKESNIINEIKILLESRFIYKLYLKNFDSKFLRNAEMFDFLNEIKYQLVFDEIIFANYVNSEKYQVID